MKYTGYLLIMGCISLSLSAGAWSQKGHDTVCYIADSHLTQKTRDAVENLLDNKSIIYYSNWLDNASHTPEYACSKTWHYKNVDADKTYESAPQNPDGDIVTALNSQITIIKDTTLDNKDRALALKMIIHFLGDIHQPMHLGHLSDRGGNSHYVKFFKRNTNLHSVWDYDLPESGHRWSHTEWAREIDRPDEEVRANIIRETDPKKWAEESWLLATAIYSSTPVNTAISYDYIAQWTPTVENQLLKGGLRLANLLNSIFDNDYMPDSEIIIVNEEEAIK